MGAINSINRFEDPQALRLSPQGISCQDFRAKLEARQRYYSDLISFSLSNEDKEGADVLLQDFYQELEDYFVMIVEDKRDSLAIKEKKIKALVEIARQGFGDYLGVSLVQYSIANKKFNVTYCWTGITTPGEIAIFKKVMTETVKSDSFQNLLKSMRGDSVRQQLRMRMQQGLPAGLLYLPTEGGEGNP